MNLAICAAGELFGGVERHIIGLCTFLSRNGQKPLLILFHDRELAQQARAVGVDPIILSPRGPLDLQVIGRLGSHLKQNRIDVVHAHGYRAVVNCALARRSYRFAMVRTVHGLVESKRWWTLKGFKSQLYTRLERHFGRSSGATVVFVTEDLHCRHRSLERGLKTLTIHNGIDPMDPEDYRRPADLDPGRFNLLAVGRVTPIKGLEFVVEAMAKFQPDSHVVLNVIGTGPQRKELEDQARDLGVSDRVRFLGFRDNVFDYLAHGDALVMPSRHEGLPYSLLEALALGLPVIASRVGGIAEVLADSPLLHKVGDVSQIEKLVKKLENDPKRSSKGLQEGNRDLSLDSMGEKYLSLYREISLDC